MRKKVNYPIVVRLEDICPTMDMDKFILFKNFFDGISTSLVEAAKIDGASHYRVFWSIVMPVIKPAWLTLMLFAFRDIWAEVPNGTIFSEQLKTLPQIVTQITAGGTARAGSSMAVTVIMMIPPIIVFLISYASLQLLFLLKYYITSYNILILYRLL